MRTMMLGDATPPPPAWNAPPSSYAVYDVVTGVPGAIPRALGLTLLRSVFIVPGLYIAGVRGWKQLGGGAVLASIAITLGMMGVSVIQAKQNAAAAAAGQPQVGNPLRRLTGFMGAGT
jgi:hypothetical protein